jgi:hypothetical protein
MVDAFSFAFDAIYLKTQVFNVTKAFLQVCFCVFQNIFPTLSLKYKEGITINSLFVL